MDQVIENSVLDKTVHARLIGNLDYISQVARVPAYMIHKSAKPYLSHEEVDWLAHYRKNKVSGTAGLCLMGEGQNAEIKFMAMAGALIRNFIDARVSTLASMYDESGSFAPPNPTVLLIPTFCVAFDGKPLASWQLQQVYSMLVDRLAAGKLTVLYVVDWKTLKAQYGASMVEFIQNNFTILSGD